MVLQVTDGSPPSAQDVQDVLPHLTPKQLADAVWCFAKHEVKPTPELMDAVAQEIHSKLPQFRCVPCIRGNVQSVVAFLHLSDTTCGWLNVRSFAAFRLCRHHDIIVLQGPGPEQHVVGFCDAAVSAHGGVVA